MRSLHMESAQQQLTSELWQATKNNGPSSPSPMTAETTFTLLSVNKISNDSWKMEQNKMAKSFIVIYYD